MFFETKQLTQFSLFLIYFGYLNSPYINLCFLLYYQLVLILMPINNYNVKHRLIFQKMQSNARDFTKKLLIGATSVLISTMALSYYIEKLMNVKYKSLITNKLESFLYPSLVTWLGCLFCAIYGSIYAHFYQTKPNKIELKERVRLGVLFTLNYLSTNYALLYISYPLQVITKNTRYLLVVIVGVFFSRVPKNRSLKLPLSKIYIAVLITLGAGLFMYFQSNNKSKQNHFHPEKKWIGFILIFVAIVADAFFSDSQAYCKSSYKPTQNQLFLGSNLYGFVCIFLFAIVSGELYPSIAFCVSHPTVIKDVLIIAITQIVSQVSIYYVINNFKQHIYPLISTVRKIMTILLSIFIFDHKVKPMQWLGIVIVFSAMGYELLDQLASHQYHKNVKKQRSKQLSLESSQISKSNQRSGIQSRSNYHMSRRESRQIKEQSLSKYGYQWRRNEVAQNRQTSLSQQKTLKK